MLHLSESYKKRIKQLSGIKLNEIELKSITGRSGVNTLGYFIEKYILNLGEKILNSLENNTNQLSNFKIIIHKSETKIENNSLSISFELEDYSNPNQIKKIKFYLFLLVKLETDSNTVAILKYKNLNDEFNLSSKHSEQDLDNFIQEIIKRILNTERIS